jgi:hypothetical protein
MKEKDFLKLSNDLQNLARKIPLKWGKIQNDRMDKQINMFEINSFEELESQIENLTDTSKTYFRRRWFLWKCAQCDEYIFCLNSNVKPNPNPRDQAYDIEFDFKIDLRFDIKGTVIPKEFRNDINAVLVDPKEMIKFYFDKQSTGVRNKIQNRLFIIHHSCINQDREMYLRCHWEFKSKIYELYSQKINNESNFFMYQNVKADVIFIIENLDKTISFSFYAVK